MGVTLGFRDEGRSAPHLARFSRDVGCHCTIPLTLFHPMHSAINVGGVPHLAKNERDVGTRPSSGTRARPRTFVLGYTQPDLTKLALFLFRCTDDKRGTV